MCEQCILHQSSTGFKVSLLAEKHKLHKAEVMLYSQWIVSDLHCKECVECVILGIKLAIRGGRKRGS